MTDAELIRLFYESRYALYMGGRDLLEAEREAILIVVNSASENEPSTTPRVPVRYHTD